MSLVTLAQWHAPGTTDTTKKYYQLAKARINASSNPMPPPAINMLTPDEKQTLNTWLDQNAPAGSEICGSGPSQPGPSDPSAIDVSDLECHKFLAHAPGNKSAKYKVGAVVDSYTNFGFRAPWQGTFYMQVARPVIDNAQALHHWLIYRETVEDGSVTKTIGQHAGGEMINGWAPGGDTTNLRKNGDVGQELPAGTYSVEIHYNSSDPNAEDASGVEICGKRTPPQHIASLSWLGYDQGGTLSYAAGLCLDPSTSWTGTCNPGHQEPIHMVVIRPHLHVAGRHVKAVINGPNGSRVLHDKPFDFAYQVGYDTEEVLMPGALRLAERARRRRCATCTSWPGRRIRSSITAPRARSCTAKGCASVSNGSRRQPRLSLRANLQSRRLSSPHASRRLRSTLGGAPDDE